MHGVVFQNICDNRTNRYASSTIKLLVCYKNLWKNSVVFHLRNYDLTSDLSLFLSPENSLFGGSTKQQYRNWGRGCGAGHFWLAEYTHTTSCSCGLYCSVFHLQDGVGTDKNVVDWRPNNELWNLWSLYIEDKVQRLKVNSLRQVISTAAALNAHHTSKRVCEKPKKLKRKHYNNHSSADRRTSGCSGIAEISGSTGTF